MTSQNVIMGFDYGTRKIGIAVGQLITKTANPIAIISARDGIPDWSEIEKLILEWQPSQLVIGLPLNMDETESEMSRRSLKFARRLTGRFSDPPTCPFPASQMGQGNDGAIAGGESLPHVPVTVLSEWAAV